jgi:ketosteroid isomerase-like protein
MPKQSRSDAIREYFAAYKSGDRAHLERALAEDFTFTSPYDDRIDKAAYFARCWPNRSLIREHVVERILEQGDEAFALYRCMTTDGKEFHNTEFFTFEGDRLKGVQVFFGAAHRDGRFIQQQS